MVPLTATYIMGFGVVFFIRKRCYLCTANGLCVLNVQQIVINGHGVHHNQRMNVIVGTFPCVVLDTVQGNKSEPVCITVIPYKMNPRINDA